MIAGRFRWHPCMAIAELLSRWAVVARVASTPLPSANGGACMLEADDGRRFVLKRRRPGPAPAEEHRLLRLLDGLGLPVAVPLSTPEGTTWVAHEDALHELLPWLPGTPGMAARGQDDRAWAARLGETIARVHAALARLPASVVPLRLDAVASLEGWVAPALERHAGSLDLPRLQPLLASALEDLRAAGAALPVQVIHRDLHPDNLLFEGDALAGVIDFELACTGPRLFDLAYCGTSVLLADWHARPRRARWPALFAAMVDACERAGGLVPAERAALFPMLCLIELMFIAYAADNADSDVALANQAALLWLADNRRLLGL
jgi:Ser/Thr protein kinase RdoA (MazF antagonist)